MSLIATQLSFAVSGLHLLRGVSATFPAGQVSAIVGPNGAGKTTLLRLLGGELRGSSGRVAYNGEDAADLSLRALAQIRAVVTQSSHIVFDFSVEEILLMGWVHTDARLFRTQFDAVVTQCDLLPLLPRRFNTLSGGEQQRVQFARALLQICPLRKPDHACYLLLDEPTASLDVAHELQVLNLARQATAANIGVVVILHDLNLASRFADQILLLRNGELITCGAPAKVLRGDLLSDVYATPMRVERHPGLQRLMIYT